MKAVIMLYLVASVMSDSLQPLRLQPTRLFCLWDSLGKNTGVGCHFLLQALLTGKYIALNEDTKKKSKINNLREI